MIQANVKYISNGYIVTQLGALPPAIDTVYALTIAEVVYWLGKMFDPVAGAPALAAQDAPAPSIIEPSADPLLGQLAMVATIASGGFLVTQVPSIGSGAQFVEVYCVNMDAVSDALTQVFTPPPPPVE
jgi:hypothetical protein